MAVRAVLRHPHASLKRVARPLGRRDGEAIARLAGDLVDTMRAHPGCVGLAAPQLDEPLRMVAVDVTDHPKATVSHGELVLVNPRIVHASGSEVAREGCLSIPALTANVRRATDVVVSGWRSDGEHARVETSGFEARCLQHEIDHLDGILFLDRVDSLATDVFRRKGYR